ncbi:MAG: DNA methyltransferase [Chloroflexota bacterium]|nr:DNA methyltransferase [Chloroflexota bacterium]
MSQANFASGTVWTGDNLPVMRGLNSGCVDLIYLDPPFNSNEDYAAPIGSQAAGAAFKDTWTLSDIDVYEHGELAERSPAAYAVIDAARQTHGKSMMSYLIMMAVRLIEMRRILKPTGSIYLHCDDTASHYLKLLMDAVFGARNYRNTIVWKRTNAKGLTSKNLPNNHDILFRYSKSEKWTWNRQYAPYDPDYVDKFYKHVEEETGRRYTLGDLVNPNRNRPNLTYEFLGVERVWRWEKERMQKAYEEGIVVQAKPGAVPRQKRYLDEQKGAPLGSVWSDLKPIQSQARERTGYPTQKPLALLERIVEISSNEGDIVFDPFCGCATTLVAADRLNRDWAGIDLSPLAVKLVDQRIRDDRGALWGGVIVRDDPPLRSDMGKLPNYRTHRHRLYGEQEGVCAGCDTHFPFKVMEVDHILPRVQGGSDHYENLQLLCTHCNKSKGGKTMAEWRAAQAG